MATIVKIKGLDRGKSVPADASVTSGSFRGFRVPSGLGQRSVLGNKAYEIVGTVGAPNAAVKYTSVVGGSLGNAWKVVHAAPSGSGAVAVVTTYAASTGAPTITVTPASSGGTGQTAAQVVAAVNADPTASQYVVASLPTAADGAAGTGASNAVASANANAVVSLSQGSGTSTAGTFTLTFPGFGTTAAIAYNATGAQVATAVGLLTGFVGGTITGSGTTLPVTITLTFSGTLASLPIPIPTVDNTLNVGGTYAATETTWGSAASGALFAGNNVGAGQAFYADVNTKGITLVDVDDAQTQKTLRRNSSRYISLGAA